MVVVTARQRVENTIENPLFDRTIGESFSSGETLIFTIFAIARGRKAMEGSPHGHRISRRGGQCRVIRLSDGKAIRLRLELRAYSGGKALFRPPVAPLSPNLPTVCA